MLEVHPEVAAALAEGRPVVALESAFLTHGLPPPRGRQAAMAMLEATRAGGAVPAMVAVVGGRLAVGLEEAGVDRLARATAVAKVSRRDLGPVLAAGALGGTTVSASLTAAATAGIRVLATGGIGGVHRDKPPSGDVSADLPQLARCPVAVVCSGAKAILDLRRTLEMLETLGVPVVGYRCDELPAFYSPASGLALDHRVNDADAAATVCRAHWGVEPGGLLFAVPPPAASALDARTVEPLIDEALGEARAAGIRGAAATPFLLGRLAEATGGGAVAANLALLERNARVAAEIAVALSRGGA